MGMYTRYELYILEGNTVPTTELIQELRSSFKEAGYALDENGDTWEECKWYDHDNDMKAFSKLHPEVLFKLAGEGEENYDMWEKYYLDGKVQVCEANIVFDKFDPELLK